MILVDTSVWVEHLRVGNDQLRNILSEGQVCNHSFVIGELACGNLQNRKNILTLLGSLPEAGIAQHSEVLHLIESKQLFGSGLGWIDIHLLASALIDKLQLWTLDRRLKSAASLLGVAYS